MKTNWYKSLTFMCLLTLVVAHVITGCTTSPDAGDISWPETKLEQCPWTYWWWHGSAVDKQNLTANLEDMAEAGMGGVHIIPIYGVRGYEDDNISYLSPRWIEMLEYTAAEAHRLGMGVDMTTGTGWPFGGPHVSANDAASLVRIETFDVEGTKRFKHRIDTGTIQAAVAFSPAGEYIDLTGGIGVDSVVWDVPGGQWTVYIVIMDGTKQQVKRAAPGGEGNVIDYFSNAALAHYLSRFDSAFAGIEEGIIRAFYNDSYEVYRANWTDDFLNEFRVRCNYDLKRYLPALLGTGDDDIVARVRHDYNETASDLLLERFTLPWVEWCHSHGGRTRNQAHGSPGNLLDLYAAADIPETEAFGPSGFSIPGLRIDRNIPPHFGKPDILVQKFASSAAHITGKRLVSSESCTWLGEHFQVSLSQVKPEIDALFVSGINHVFFHGMAYSPMDAPWPGRLFYASTNFAHTGSFRKALPELNTYIARCQSFLQGGEPDNDILLYWPVHDIWRSNADEDMLHHFQVHNAGEWLYGSPFHDAAKTMWDKGYAFDYISDRQLGDVRFENGFLVVGATKFSVIVVPGCRYMPADTLERIVNLARQGATVLFTGDLPKDVPGLSDLEIRRARFRKAEIPEFVEIERGIFRAQAGEGFLLKGLSFLRMLEISGVFREEVADFGIEFVRRRYDNGYVYFLTNPGDTDVERRVTLSVGAKSAVLFDPVTGQSGVTSVRKGIGGESKVYLSIEPGASMILRTYDDHRARGRKWQYAIPDGEPVEVEGRWNVSFVDGGPVIPAAFETRILKSWTETGDKDALAFHGTARYAITIEKPQYRADDWLLDPGDVRESAVVRVNGKEIGTVWSIPFRISIGDALKRGENHLEIEVTNLAANRIADLDRRGVDWKIFHDINFVDIGYKPFDASSWDAVQSGLLGPVRLIPVKKVEKPR